MNSKTVIWSFYSKLQVVVLFGLFTVVLSCNQAYLSNKLSTEDLRVESLKNPLGIDTKKPSFSWKLSSYSKGSYQKAYQVQVASSSEKLKKGEPDIWDSGKILSDKTRYVRYSGSELKSGESYFWHVKVWDNNGNESAWSRRAKWSMGLLSSEAWKAQWITYDTTRATSQPLFRKEFTIKNKIKKATAYVSGLGYYQLNMNGKKVGEHILDPGRTNYDDYAFYVTYDVTDLLKKGANAIGIMLGDGWYNQDKIWGGMAYGTPRLICQVEVEQEDGTSKIITSDKSWKWTNGPVIKSNVYAGEEYDARKEIEGWSTVNYDKSIWMNVEMASDNPNSLKAQMIPPIKKIEELEPVDYYKVDEEKYIYDFGQNFAGYVRLKTDAPKGTQIIMRSAEEIFPDSTLNPASTGVFATNVVQTDEYISKGNGINKWEPRFTYHGFRYVEVNGISEPSKDLLTGIVAHSAVKKVGNFKSSNNQINRLHEMADWTLKSNLHSVPTDCPHREKAGWIGDTHAFAKMSIFNYDMENFWIKYLNDVRSSARKEEETLFFKAWDDLKQCVKPRGIPYMVAPGKRKIGAASPDWGTALVQLPWYLYIYYGNEQILEDFYPQMKKWVSYIEELSEGHIVKSGLGDWCPPGQITPDATPMPLTSTAFHFFDVKIMEQVAEKLGKVEDHREYQSLKNKIRDSFIDQFYNPRKKTFGSQTANALALDLDLVPNGDQKAVSTQIAKLSREELDGFLNTGIFGLSRIFDALSNFGNEKAAYEILTKKGYNSFQYMWSHYDATTLWEILPVDNYYAANKDKGEERSHNHPMQGGYDAWFYQGILGINPDLENPGFKNIIFRPVFFEQLSWAKGSYDSPKGKIISDWSWNNDQLKWKVSIPPSTTGELHLPYDFAENIKIDQELVEGEKINKPGEIVYYRYELGSGAHIVSIGS